jgi:integral membrane protein (TIGR01906 family)
MVQRWTILGWLVPVALMLLVITSNTRFVANSLPVYDALFERNQVVVRTGITPDGLHDVAAQIQRYFGSDEEPLQVTAVVNGVERSLFRADEASHMADVKQLFRKTYRVQAASALFLLIVAAAAVLTFRKRSLGVFATWARRGGLVTAGTIAVVGVASLVAFDQVFLLFHYIGFPQGNFLFDTRTDFLVRVFPFGFWSDVTMLIGILTLFEAGVLVAAGFAVARLTGRRRRIATDAGRA